MNTKYKRLLLSHKHSTQSDRQTSNNKTWLSSTRSQMTHDKQNTETHARPLKQDNSKQTSLNTSNNSYRQKISSYSKLLPSLLLTPTSSPTTILPSSSQNNSGHVSPKPSSANSTCFEMDSTSSAAPVTSWLSPWLQQ